MIEISRLVKSKIVIICVILFITSTLSIICLDQHQSKIILNYNTEQINGFNAEALPRRRSSSSLYFVHGYGAENTQFFDMIEFLSSYKLLQRYSNTDPFFFDYLEKYLGENLSINEIHNIKGGISQYAEDFFNQLCETHKVPSQIDIVAHSLGGLIVRELIRVHRTDLESIGISFRTVITLGSPHLGSVLVVHPLKETLILFTDHGWDTKVIDMVEPQSEFLTTLNTHPEEYMSDIEWHFIAGVSLGLIETLGQRMIFSGSSCDGFVPLNSALGYDLEEQTKVSISRIILQKDHYGLIYDPIKKKSYSTILSIISNSKIR